MALDTPTFMGHPVEFVPSHEDAASRTYIFNPDAKVGPHTAVEFLTILAEPQKPTFFWVITDHLQTQYWPKWRSGTIVPKEPADGP